MHRLIALAVVLLPFTAVAEPVNETAQMRDELTAVKQQLAQQGQVVADQASQIRELRDRLGDNWLNERRIEEVKTLIAEVLGDADTRASLRDDGLTAGWQNGFFLASPDGTFYLRVLGMLQARHTWSLQDDSADVLPGDEGEPDDDEDDSTDDSRAGFGISRSRFGFKGHVVDPTWTFLLWSGYDCTGKAVVLDAHITKKLNDNWSVTAGQFKLPYLYEYLVSETRLQFIERTLIAGEFCGTYTQGVMLTYQDDGARLRLSFNDGASTINTIWHTRTSEFAVTARGELKLTGNWKDYADWEGWPGQDPLIILGGAVHHQTDEYGTLDDESEDTRFTVDLSAEGDGCNLFLAWLGTRIRGMEDINQQGVVVQGGLFVSDKLELIARWEWADPDVEEEDDLSIVTVGFSYFIAGHQLRWTTDIGYAFESVGETFTSRPIGWRLDSPGQDGQVVIRNQIQLLF